MVSKPKCRVVQPVSNGGAVRLRLPFSGGVVDYHYQLRANRIRVANVGQMSKRSLVHVIDIRLTG